MLRFKVIRLTKEGFVQVKGPIKIVILVPFVLRIVYFIVYCRLCKVELRTEGRIRYWSLDFPNKIVTHLIWGNPYNVTWLGVNNMVQTIKRASKRKRYRISDGALCAG